MGQLQVGDRALMFNTVDALGNPVDLAAHSSNFVLLAFLRYAGCPWCNLTIHRLAVEYPLLQKSHCQVIAVVQSTAGNIQRHIYDRHTIRPQFPIIADHSRILYDQYGIRPSLMAAGRSITDIPHWLNSVFTHGFRQAEVDGSLLMVPAMFLIAPRTQKLLIAEYSKSFYEHTTFTKVYDALTFERV